MKTIKLIFMMLLAFMIKVQAQTLSPEVVSSGGTYVSGGGYSLSQTIGELSVQTVTAGTSILTQGFQQYYPGTVTGVGPLENDGIYFTVYPNPAGNVVYVNLHSEKDVLYNLRVSDVLGKDVSTSCELSSTIGAAKTIDLSMLSPGLYFITINSSDNKFLKTFPLNKN